MQFLKEHFRSSHSLIIPRSLDECVQSLQEIQSGPFVFMYRYKVNIKPQNDGASVFEVSYGNRTNNIASLKGVVTSQGDTSSHIEMEYNLAKRFWLLLLSPLFLLFIFLNPNAHIPISLVWFLGLILLVWAFQVWLIRYLLFKQITTHVIGEKLPRKK